MQYFIIFVVKKPTHEVSSAYFCNNLLNHNSGHLATFPQIVNKNPDLKVMRIKALITNICIYGYLNSPNKRVNFQVCWSCPCFRCKIFFSKLKKKYTTEKYYLIPFEWPHFVHNFIRFFRHRKQHRRQLLLNSFHLNEPAHFKVLSMNLKLEMSQRLAAGKKAIISAKL